MGQAGQLALPPGLSAQLAAQVQTLATQVFDNSYVSAMRPPIATGTADVVSAAVAALFLECRWRQSRRADPAPVEAEAA